ncbi:hypothetical protein NDU88_005295 [Pleurodeles waltl]|uniref:Uncharacterized protein n=1 Tax=Pleurodeles waltl TaxID=8319 RepID=A0AAV7SL93_PLEWA|nr:hypothetical protein NDU88_005295 [Pleurodeles waltl]
MLSGPSEEAAWADAAASNPERESVASNLPGIKGQQQTGHAPGKQEEEETLAGRRGRAEEAGVTGEEEGRLLQRSVKIQEPSGSGNGQKVPWRDPQLRQWRRWRTAKFPATLQEKRGQTRCVHITD